MEQLNKIELVGVVGSSKTSTTTAGNKQRTVTRFTVATNYAYKDKDGFPVIETTWHTVVAWDLNAVPQKNDKVCVTGRLRASRYEGEDGVERTAYEVLAETVSILDTDKVLEMQIAKSEAESKEEKKTIDCEYDVSFYVTTSVKKTMDKNTDIARACEPNKEISEELIKSAVEKILENPGEYICPDNLECIELYTIDGKEI